MSSGITHTIIGGMIAFSFFFGAVLIDIDHLKTHTIKELKNGFIGKAKLDYRDDTQHFFHKPIFYNTVFLITLMTCMFSIGLYIHLKMDGII